LTNYTSGTNPYPTLDFQHKQVKNLPVSSISTTAAATTIGWSCLDHGHLHLDAAAVEVFAVKP
jgi:hypothetical protein